ncbi:PX domain-containing protein [Cryptosporidium andersoni]|uniref:PX domain-containing protein n=1 Tax=Cryptosporidium andersoni TaxID=117008 RepID=A0A1J4MEL2_9CRYT|nr:PX domain-containing protein [Cryptosporidium andersoni]
MASEINVTAQITGWVPVESSTVSYKIYVNGPFKSYQIQKRYSEFAMLQSLLYDHGFSLLPSLPPKTFLSKPQDPVLIKERQQGLQAYLNNILKRLDIYSSSIFLNFLQIPSSLQNSRFLPNLKFELLADLSEGQQAVSNVFIEKLVPLGTYLAFISYQDNSSLSRLGKVWSIIEPEDLGSLYIWDLQSNRHFNRKKSFNVTHRNSVDNFQNAIHTLLTNTTLDSSKFNCLINVTFSYRCKGVIYLSETDTLCVFSEKGYLEIYSGIMNICENLILSNITSNPKNLREIITPRNILIHHDQIQHVHLPNYLNNNESQFSLSIGIDNSVRLFCLKQMKIISGGNVTKRLQGTKLTCCYLEQNFARLGFFGSNSGIVLVLDMASHPPYLTAQLKDSSQEAITCITVSNDYIIVAYTDLIRIYNVTIDAEQGTCIINDNQPLWTIEPYFFSDMSMGHISSMLMVNNNLLFVGGQNVLAIFFIENYKRNFRNSPKLLLSYSIHSGSIISISKIPDDIITNNSVDTSTCSDISYRPIKFLTASHDGIVLFWKLCIPEFFQNPIKSPVKDILTLTNSDGGFETIKDGKYPQINKSIKTVPTHFIPSQSCSDDNSEDDLTSAFR